MEFAIINIPEFAVQGLGGKIFSSSQKFEFMKGIILAAIILRKRNHLTCNSSFSVCRANIHLRDFRHIFIVAKRLFQLDTNKSRQYAIFIVDNYNFLSITHKGFSNVLCGCFACAVKLSIQNVQLFRIIFCRYSYHERISKFKIIDLLYIFAKSKRDKNRQMRSIFELLCLLFIV